jgi:hypothetical protein
VNEVLRREAGVRVVCGCVWGVCGCVGVCGGVRGCVGVGGGRQQGSHVGSSGEERRRSLKRKLQPARKSGEPAAAWAEPARAPRAHLSINQRKRAGPRTERRGPQRAPAP